MSLTISSTRPVSFAGRITLRGEDLGHIHGPLMTRLHTDGVHHIEDVSHPPMDDLKHPATVFHMVLATGKDLHFFRGLKAVENAAAKLTLDGRFDPNAERALIDIGRKLREVFYLQEPVVDLGSRKQLTEDEYVRVRDELKKQSTDPELIGH